MVLFLPLKRQKYRVIKILLKKWRPVCKMIAGIYANRISLMSPPHARCLFKTEIIKLQLICYSIQGAKTSAIRLIAAEKPTTTENDAYNSF